MDLTNLFVLLATTANEITEEPDPPGFFNPTFLIAMIVIIVAFYVLIQRPQRQQQEERQRQINEMKRGDKVVTIGGIHGTVARLNKQKDTVLVTVARGVEMEFNRTAVTIQREDPAAKEKAKQQEQEPEDDTSGEDDADSAAPAETPGSKPPQQSPFKGRQKGQKGKKGRN